MRVPAWVRAGLLAAVAGGALAFGGVAAFAANQTVQIVAINGTTCTSEFCFVPSSVSVNSGDTVTWNNSSPDLHNVTRCDATNCAGQGPGTGADTLSSGGNITPLIGTFAHSFSGAGTYFYYCTIHGYSVMHGEVTVASTPPTDTPEAPGAALLIGGAAAASGLAGAAVVARRRTRA